MTKLSFFIFFDIYIQDIIKPKIGAIKNLYISKSLSVNKHPIVNTKDTVAKLTEIKVDMEYILCFLFISLLPSHFSD